MATRRILASERTLDVCVKDPCEEIAIYSTTDGCGSVETCMGDTPCRSAVASGRLELIGPKKTLARNTGSSMISAGKPDS